MVHSDHGDQRSYARNGYALLAGLLGSSVHSFLNDYAVKAVEAGRFTVGDTQLADTPRLYGDPLMETLLEMLVPRVEAETGHRLYPTYSYLRVYQRGDVLARHTDRASCETSLTINLGCQGNERWPIWLDPDGEARAFDLDPGDGLLYRGIEVPHWREAFRGERMVQLFLHYVDREGPHK